MEKSLCSKVVFLVISILANVSEIYLQKFLSSLKLTHNVFCLELILNGLTFGEICILALLLREKINTTLISVCYNKKPSTSCLPVIMQCLRIALCNQS